MLKSDRTSKLSTSMSLGIILTSIVGFNSVAVAQSKYDNDGYQSNEKSGVFGDAPSGLDPVELMHRAQQANSRSQEEFNTDSQGQLNNSVSDFKRLQQQRILEQQQPLEANPVETQTPEGNTQ